MNARCRFFLVLFPLVLAAAAGVLQAETTLPALHFIAPTRGLNPESGRHDALRIEFRETPLGELGNVLKRTHDELPPFEAVKPPTIVLYLAAGRTVQQAADLKQAAVEQFQIAYPGIVPRFEVRVLERQATDAAALSKDVDDQIRAVEQASPDDEEAAKVAQALREANEAALAETRYRKLKEGDAAQGVENLERPTLLRRILRGFGLVRSVLVFGSRVAQVAAPGVPTGERLAAGIALVAGDTACEYFTVRFQTQIGRFFAAHGLPVGAGSRFLQRLNEVYRKNDVARYAKSSVLNLAIYGMGKPLAMQTLGHLATPQTVPGVTGADVGDLFVNNLMGTVAYTLGFQGFERLRQKGWMSGPQVDLAFRILGMLDVASNFFNSSPHLKSLRIFTQGPVWGAYLMAFAAGWLAPVRRNRLILIDPEVALREEVDAVEATDSTKKADWKCGNALQALAQGG